MSRHSSTVIIRRPLAEVYAYMDDVAREREWQPALRSAAKDPPGATRVGTRKIYESEFLGRRVKNIYQVLEMEPGRRVVQQTIGGSSARIWSEVLWTEHPEGTAVTLTVEAEPQGLLRLIPRHFLESATRSELEGSLRALKRALEGSGRP
jgi:uncharacterized membrane protein